jgi:hypothetical protein
LRRLRHRGAGPFKAVAAAFDERVRTAIWSGDSQQITIELTSIGVGVLAGVVCAELVGASSLLAGPIGSAMGAIGCVG